MGYKKWLVLWGYVPIFILLVGTINSVMDPLWIFNHSFPFNNYQEGFNERLLKSTPVAYQHPDYDGLLLGSSRVTIYDETVLPERVYNYAFNGCYTYELQEFITFFKTHNKRPLKTIYIGLDFYSALTTGHHTDKIRYLKDNETMRKNFFPKPVYILKSLFNLDTLKHSYTNFKLYLNRKNNGEKKKYNRQHTPVKRKKSKPKDIQKRIQPRITELYTKNHFYDPSYKQTLERIKKENPECTLYIFTTPVSVEHLKRIASLPALNDAYRRWITDITDVFGTVFFTTFPSQLSKDYLLNSFDGDHYYDDVGKELLLKLANPSHQSTDIIEKSYIWLTKNNRQTVFDTFTAFTQP